MKHKPFYIIAAFLLTVLLLIHIEIRHQTDIRQISTLTAEKVALEQDIVTLRNTTDKQEQEINRLTNEIEHIKAQQTKQPEAQKTNHSADRPRYSLTDAERDLVERVVMAESGGESCEGQMLVAQCILNACEIDGIRPAEAIKRYAYAKGRPKPTDSVIRAVSAVFDRGEQVTDEPIIYFYAPAMVKSKFHERQRFICEVGGHRFFCER